MATPFVSDQSSRNVERVCQVEASRQEQPNVNLPRAAAEKRVVGFDCEFVERPAKAFQVDCPVCLLVLREPHQATCCGYSYCQPCIERVQFDKKPCPTCNTAEFSVFPNKGFQRSLYEFHVRCSHEKDGCQWTGELGELDKHLNESPILGRQFIGCEFAEVECNDCGKSFQRQHFRAHQLEQHPFSCEYCHDYESYYEDVVKNHWPVCGFYPVPCPKECGVYPERQNLEHHVSKDCPLTVVNCNFHYAGCEVQLIRQDLPAHLAENLVPHMAQLATYNQKKVQEKDQQIMQLTEDLRQELEKNRQKIHQVEKENEALSTSLLEKKDEIAQLQEDLRVKDKSTAEKITKLREDTRVKEETLKQEIAQLTKKNENAVADALKEITQLQEHIRKKDEAVRQEIVELKQEQQESENKLKTTEEEAQKKDEKLQHEIAALKRRQEDAVSKEESEAIKQEIAELREKSVSKEENEAVKQEVIQIGKKQRETVSKEDYETTKQELTQLKAKQKEDRSLLQTLQSHIATLPIEFTMAEFAKHKRDGDEWYSDPFYSHLVGYKMCLGVYANGCGDGLGTHTSVSVYLMRGEWDNILKWPFRGDITIQVLNQIENKGHYEKTIPFTDEAPDNATGRVTTGERSCGLGYGQFISHDALNYNKAKNCQYLKCNCLQFKISDVKLKN